jgi:hypothetical protein
MLQQFKNISILVHQ